MPLASVANLAPVLDLDEERGEKDAGRPAAGRLGHLGGAGHDRAQAAPLVPDPPGRGPALRHRPPASRSPGRRPGPQGQAAFHPEGELPEDYRERFALDHDHPAHLENQADSPFAAGEPADTNGGGPDHEHPPWTATSRGIETSLQASGHAGAGLPPRSRPDHAAGGSTGPPTIRRPHREVRMTDFRLLRYGGFYHAVARYGPDVWTPFTYAGLHATERALRRKEQHRFWGVDYYSHEEDRYLRIGNRLFYEDPDQAVEPSAQIVVAHDAWARELARTPCPAPRPPCSAPPTGSAAKRWNCVPPATWCRTPPDIPPWAETGAGRAVAERQSRPGGHRRPGRPTGCS